MGSGASRHIIDKFADIMRLRRCVDSLSPRLVFYSGDEAELEELFKSDPRLSKIPRDGWRRNEEFIVNSLYHTHSPDMIFDFGGYNELDIAAYLKLWISLSHLYQRQLPECMPLHAALVEREGRGALLAASGGTGKSTCCRRIPAPWKALCDDESLLIDSGGDYVAHPFPTWSEYLLNRSESTWSVESHVPVSAVFFLEQAPEDGVTQLSREQAALYICNFSVQALKMKLRRLEKDEESGLRQKTFNGACRLARKVPCYNLRVSLTGRFWSKMEEVLGF